MPTIDTELQKNIRKPFDITIRVGYPNTYFSFNTEDIISVELNLRSDLSPIDPSLPESQIIIRAYAPTDVSDRAKAIPIDEPLIYRAGYREDMSPERRFYISEPLTWADKVLTIKAVDAIHFLDAKMPACFIGKIHTSYYATGSHEISLIEFANGDTGYGLEYLKCLFNEAIRGGGVSLVYDEFIAHNEGGLVAATSVRSFIEETTRRELIANMMNLTRVEFTDDPVAGSQNLWLNYIDAGRPTCLVNKPSSKWTIYEKDCGDIKKNVARDIVEITADNKLLVDVDYNNERAHSRYYRPSMNCGSFDVTKNVGGAISLKNNVVVCVASGSGDNVDDYYDMLVSGLDSVQNDIITMTHGSNNFLYGCELFSGSSYMDWNTTLSDFWNQQIDLNHITSSQQSYNFNLYGGYVRLKNDKTTYTKSGQGTHETPTYTRWYGRMRARGSYNSTLYKVLPEMGFEQLMDRSGVTGSFTWKGDPRMQPRDVFTFVYKDGTTEERTIETINLKHEGGGTVAEITYRKGIV